MLWGYPDVGGLVFAAVALILHWRKPWRQRGAVELAALGISLAVMVLFRRWYAYWTVAFFSVAFIEEVGRILRDGATRAPGWWKGLRNFFVAGLVSLFVFAAAAGPMVAKMLLTNYAFLYSYARSDLATSLRILIGRIGIIHLVAFLVGGLICLSRRESRHRVIFCLSQLAVILVLFLRTQDFDAHHVYLLIPAITLLLLSGMEHLFRKDASRGKVSAGIGYLALSAYSLPQYSYRRFPRRLCSSHARTPRSYERISGRSADFLPRWQARRGGSTSSRHRRP